MTDWNFVDVWREIARAQPDHLAIEQAERHITWQSFADSFDRLGTYFKNCELPAQSTIALYMYNCPEYVIGFAGALAGGHVPINTNYRYGSEELHYLFDNADARIVIFHGAFLDRVSTIRRRLPLVERYLFVDDGTATCPDWAVPFETALATEPERLPAPSGDGLIMQYTGGTTGMPKGVMWRQDDLFVQLNGAGFLRYPEDATVDDVAELIRESGQHPSLLPACPLMHGTGLFTTLRSLSEGGRIVLLAKRTFDAVELIETLNERQVRGTVIVGDFFARPMVDVLRNNPGRYSLSTLQIIGSSGAMWSQDMKTQLLELLPHVLLADAFGSSEALGIGASVSTSVATTPTASFALGVHSRVVHETGRPVIPGSGEIGQLMIGGRNPIGYYKDPVKTAATFPVIDGVRFVVPGDMATIEADGTLRLLGRGSQCINTAGEKVYPEEVEEALKTHPDVVDACVVGVEDPRYGQRVVAVVETTNQATIGEEMLILHVKDLLAAYKAPKSIRFVESIGRAVNGKVDYRRHREEATSWLESNQV